VSVSHQSPAQLRNALWLYALLRWESALLLALILVISAGAFVYRDTGMIPTWTWLACIAFGLLAEITLIISSVTDKSTLYAVLGDSRSAGKTQAVQLDNHVLQTKVNKAFDYRQRIEHALLGKHSQGLHVYLQDTLDHINQWLGHINTLAQRLDEFQNNQRLIADDQRQAKKRRSQLKRRLEIETNEATCQQLQATLGGLEKQLDSIQQLQNTMQSADLKLEHSLSALSTLHSQTLLMAVKTVENTQVQALQREVDSEISELNDVLQAMDIMSDTATKRLF